MRRTSAVAVALLAGLSVAVPAVGAGTSLRPGFYTLCEHTSPQLLVSYTDDTWWFSSRRGGNVPWVGPFAAEPVSARIVREFNRLAWTHHEVAWVMRWGGNAAIGMQPGWTMHDPRTGKTITPDVIVRTEGGELPFCRVPPPTAPEL